MQHQAWGSTLQSWTGNARVPDVEVTRYVCYECGADFGLKGSWRHHATMRSPIGAAQSLARGSQCGACGTLSGD
eukprot:2540657-Pyramimonas_sp.AAC.1